MLRSLPFKYIRWWVKSDSIVPYRECVMRERDYVVRPTTRPERRGGKVQVPVERSVWRNPTGIPAGRSSARVTKIFGTPKIFDIELQVINATNFTPHLPSS